MLQVATSLKRGSRFTSIEGVQRESSYVDRGDGRRIRVVAHENVYDGACCIRIGQGTWFACKIDPLCSAFKIFLAKGIEIHLSLRDYKRAVVLGVPIVGLAVRPLA